jgi:hypothetical protein
MVNSVVASVASIGCAVPGQWSAAETTRPRPAKNDATP